MTKRIWQYEIRNHPSPGEWATIFIREDGIFTAVSSYGNYGYFWSSTGHGDVRRFLLRCRKDTDYFLKKLSPRTSVDSDKSIDALKKEICRARREREINRATARDCWINIDSYGDDWEGIIRDGTCYSFTDTYEVCQLSAVEHDPNAVAFCELILPKLSEMIEKELDMESGE